MHYDTDRTYDALLVARGQGGDAAALDELVRRWNPRLYRHALSVTGDREAAWDVVQDSWMAMVRRLGELEEPLAFPAWALRIVHRRAVDWVRKRMRRRARDQRLAEQAPPPVRPPSDDPRAVALAEALAALPPDRRMLIDLFYYQGLTLAEIAEVLDSNVGAVKTRIHRCRAELRRLIEENQP